MKKYLISLIMMVLFVKVYTFEATFMKDPTISPDGNKICFVYLSDLWEVNFNGGDARRLTSSNAEDYNPVYSADNKWIAFNSNRDGFGGLYKMPVKGGKAELISDKGMTAVQWYQDGKSILCTKYIPGVGSGIFRVFFNGDFPELITEIGDTFSSLSKNEDKIIFNNKGYWDREKYTGSHNGDLWVYDIKLKKYSEIAKTNDTERYPQFSRCSDKTFFCKSDGNVFQIYEMNNLDFESRKQISKFPSKYFSPRDLSIARENDNICYEMFDKIGIYDSATGFCGTISINIPEDLVVKNEVREVLRSRFKDYYISEDEKFVAFSYRYDLFVMPLKGGEVKQVTDSQNGIYDILISSDSKRIFFVSYVKGKATLFQTNINNLDKISPVVDFKNKEIDYIYSSGKNSIIIKYYSDENIVNYAYIDENNKTHFLKNIPENTIYLQLSPQNNFLIVKELSSDNWNYNVYLMDLVENKSEIILRSEKNLYPFVWSDDESFIFYSLKNSIYRLDLIPRKDDYLVTNNWDELLKSKTEKSTGNNDKNKDKKNDKEKDKKISVEWDNLDKRYKIIFTQTGYNYPIKTISDTTLYVGNEKDNKGYIYKVNFNGKHKKKMTTIADFNKKYQNIFINDKLFYLQNECLYEVDLKSQKKSQINYNYVYYYNKNKLNEVVFSQLWNILKFKFYDPYMHGLDWNLMYKIFLPYIKNIHNTSQLASIVNEMVGELDASHTGFYPRDESKGHNLKSIYLGCEFDYKNVKNKGIILKKVYSNSNLAKIYNIKAGDILMQVDDFVINKDNSVEKVLRDNNNKFVKLTFLTGEGEKEVKLKPLSYYGDSTLRYQNWVEERRKIIEKIDPEIGYIHVRRMDGASAEKFKKDLYSTNADKKAIILDLRSNGGGRTHDILLDALKEKPYSYSTSRFHFQKKYTNPRRTFEKPIVLLINEDSFSDAEIFPHLFKFMKLGKIIGMPTSGSVIGTWPTTLMDGSSIRIPGSGWYTLDGKNMEGNGAVPDIIVEQSFEDKINDNDVQLKRAVLELQKELKK